MCGYRRSGAFLGLFRYCERPGQPPGRCSSASENKTSSESSKPGSSASKDTVTIVQHVKDSSGSAEDLTYYSSGIFCWTEGCEKDFVSSSSVESSSSDEIIIAASSASVEPPSVNGNTMVDNRDGRSYKLQNVGGKLWMAQDLAFKTGNSMCFDDNEAKCEEYGRLYAYVSATKACPPGWRLPTRNEVTTLFADDTYPWSYSGRCKDGECGFTGDMGFHWINATPEATDKNFDKKVLPGRLQDQVLQRSLHSGVIKSAQYFATCSRTLLPRTFPNRSTISSSGAAMKASALLYLERIFTRVS